MKILLNPTQSSWSELSKRPQLEAVDLERLVSSVFEKVKVQGDQAVKEFTSRFDRLDLTSFEISAEQILNAEKKLSPELCEAIRQASENIKAFHKAQLREPLTVETMPGVRCQRIARPIQNIGLYVPGGTAPLFSSVLMLAIPARVAGCKSVNLCTPPDADGEIHPAILFAAKITGVDKVFRIGGAQAVAAMTYGTATVPKVDKIFGPGNQYVTMAKQIAARSGVAIDLPAGPSEVLVIGDEQANPAFIAADLLSQAEHGPDSQVIFTTTSQKLAEEVITQLTYQTNQLNRKEIVVQSLKNSLAIVFPDTATCLAFSNVYAPEHLIINAKDADSLLDQVTNAGSVFLGPLTPEAAGDYASGTNHTLPTNGYAKMYGGVSTDSFLKYITVQEINKEGLLRLGPVVEQMANAEGLDAHANAVSIRLNTIR